MKFIITLLIPLITFHHVSCDSIPANFSVSFFDQKIDHFNYINNATFKQRMIISTDHWCNDGCPIFFYAGNEGEIFSFANNTGFMWENAPDYNAMVIFVEHRYYGQSLPFGNDTFKNTSFIGYLSASQALADYAEVISSLKLTDKRAKNSPVIMFGGSYGGMLAAWFRMKYPHLVVGALASSAPVWQFEGLYDCRAYYDQISNSFRGYSQDCWLSIKNSWSAFDRIGSTSEGLKWIKNTFRLCQDLSSESFKDFKSWVTSTYDSLAMTDYPNDADFLAPLPAYPINVTCTHLQDPHADDETLILSIYRAVSVFYNYTGKTSCNNYRDDSDSGRLGGDGWSFQACTEMVLPVCSVGELSMFPPQNWDLNQYSNDCLTNLGVRPEPFKAELLFGGKNIQAASNIIFSNGERDPWGPGGVHKTGSKTLIPIMIPHACHHEDLRFSGKNDPSSLTAARNQIKAIIKQWIQDYYLKHGFVPRAFRNRRK